MSLSADELRELYPFRSHFAEVSGNRLHYLDEGSGEPILCLHGNPTWSFMYRRLVTSLSDRYRVIVPDHIGCGLSDKPSPESYSYRFSRRVEDLESLLEKLGLGENLTLVVHDWGGLIGFAYAVRHPERVSRLVVFNTTAFFPAEGGKLHWTIRFCRTSRTAAYLILRFNLFARLATFFACRRRRMPEMVRRGYLYPYDSPDNRIGVLRFVQDIPLEPSDPSYGTLQATEESLGRLRGKPLLICWGDRDFVFNDVFLSGWHQHFPDAQTHRYPEAGHYVLEDAFEEICTSVAKFLERHPV